MTQSDQNIIDLLQKNARFSNEDIAAQLGIEATEVDTRIQSMLDAGIIRQFTTIINETKVDSPTTKALVELSIRPERNTGYDAIAHRICSYPEVESHHLVSGTYDFLLVVCGKTHKEIAHFVFDKLATIENVTSTTTHFIFKSYKEHGVLMDDHNESTRLAIMP